MAVYKKFESIKSNKIIILAKNPVNGGIPAIEKKIITKENAHKLLYFAKF